MVSIYALGGISGANFNPAVSVTLGISKSIGGPGLDWMTVGIYSGVQCAAGVLAGVCYSLLFGESFNLAPAKGFTWYQAGLCELLYTFMLTFVVMNVAAAKKNATEKNQYYGMAIAFTVVAGAYGAGAVSGGCFNPAVALGIDLSSAGLGFGWSLVYIVFELLGAALAAALFKVVRPEDFGGEKSQITELVSEFLGTYMLVLTVGLNVLGKSKAAAFSIAAGLTSMIYATGDVSGAHFNPAVTVAIFASGRCPELTPAKAGTYAAVQIAAGITAALTYAFIYQGATFGLGPVGFSTWAGVSVAEIVYTFVLCLVVLCVAVSERTKASHMFGLAIGSCVTVGGFAIGGISGGSLNPAVSFLWIFWKYRRMFFWMLMFCCVICVVAKTLCFPQDLDLGEAEQKAEVWYRCSESPEWRCVLQGFHLRILENQTSFTSWTVFRRVFQRRVWKWSFSSQGFDLFCPGAGWWCCSSWRFHRHTSSALVDPSASSSNLIDPATTS